MNSKNIHLYINLNRDVFNDYDRETTHSGEIPLRGSSDSSISLRPIAHNFRVNCAGDTIMQLSIQFRELVSCK